MELRGPSEVKAGVQASFGLRSDTELTAHTVVWRFSGPTYFELTGQSVGVNFGVPGTYHITAVLKAPEGEIVLANRSIVVAPQGVAADLALTTRASERPPSTSGAPQTPFGDTGPAPPTTASLQGPELQPGAKEAGTVAQVGGGVPAASLGRVPETRPGGSEENAAWMPAFASGVANPRLLAAGDLDGDGLADLALCPEGGRSLTIFRSQGNGRFDLKATVEVGFTPERIIVAHYAGSTLADVLAVNFTTRKATLFVSTSPFQFSGPTRLSLPVGATDLWSWQLNDHPAFELVWLIPSGLRVWTLVGDGKGVVEWPGLPQYLAFSPPSSPVRTWGDFTGDGVPEFAFCSLNPGELFLLTAAGAVALGRVPPGVSLVALSAGDVDGDGFVDLVALDHTGTIRILNLKGLRGGAG